MCGHMWGGRGRRAGPRFIRRCSCCSRGVCCLGLVWLDLVWFGWVGECVCVCVCVCVVCVNALLVATTFLIELNQRYTIKQDTHKHTYTRTTHTHTHRRHLSSEATRLGRKILVRCALREALERAARLAGG
jgi:hypothetical protein